MILVTGSSGHLGEALVRTLRSAGRPVRGIDIKPSPFTDAVGSIGDRAFVKANMVAVREVIHTATLHKPHVGTHSYEDFVATNINGTLILLEESITAGVDAFVFTSTTSAFGAALTPAPGEPAAWITESVTPVPKNIYGVTKIAAEKLCELFYRKHQLPVVVLRTSRFFPEADDNAAIRERFSTANAQVNELLYRRGDVEDMVSAHLCALARAPAIGFNTYIVSALTPLTHEHLHALRENAPAVVRQLFPDYEEVFASLKWTMFSSIDRVYTCAAAMADLGWRPQYDFARALQQLRAGGDHRSALAIQIGQKGYHDVKFTDGPYPLSH